ncbi:MAG: nitrate reductase molybdenum cofactor assembly chaperone [Deltaproteobacteria bacterium]|nr:MAG: nitrate reductase molybdenum cofactor assembly chaperone [Deltaproteobacteria bacterium]
MTDEKRYLLKVLAILLQYPDDEFILSLEELKEAVEQIPRVEQRERCVNFLDYLGNNSLIRLQEEYTSSFDLNPTTCLNLTYHRWGDARERGRALVDFHQLYEAAGYECATGELPDYLPLVLEYLSLSQNGGHSSFLGQYWEQVETISSGLQEAGSVYAGLLEIVADLFNEMKTNGV